MHYALLQVILQTQLIVKITAFTAISQKGCKQNLLTNTVKQTINSFIIITINVWQPVCDVSSQGADSAEDAVETFRCILGILLV